MSEKFNAVSAEVNNGISLLSRDDLFLFNEGRHYRLYQKLGAHYLDDGSSQGVYFAVWAPNALKVSVTGDFNNWQDQAHPLKMREQSGIWEGFISGLTPGARYKFHIESRYSGYKVDKADPLAFRTDNEKQDVSVVECLPYTWSDSDWMKKRSASSALNAPISIYEMHLGSWKKNSQSKPAFFSYREIAPQLADYVTQMGFTHIELLPVMEHPFYGSWGYQLTGYFSPTRRYGLPEDLMYLIDYLHQRNIGVILDWVPSHFPDDTHGLSFFDGTHLFEHADPQLGLHPDWDSLIFNYGRHEVRSFLISSALFWLDSYHADGLRVDAVASMLYLDYSRKRGQWKPNRFGGRENLEAIQFIKALNQAVYKNFPDVQTFAEESSAWPQVSRPTYLGGLGFGYKWDMGWMHDSLRYLSQDPIFRKFHHQDITFRGMYSLAENYVLPLSHDEVVYGKGSLFSKMPGHDEYKFSNLRLLFGIMFAQPGKKLLFMGDEFGQRTEWDHDGSLDWQLLDYAVHRQMQQWVSDLNRFYRAQPALYEEDYSPRGFQWIDVNDVENSAFSFIRKSSDGQDVILVVFNCTPVPRFNYRVGVPGDGIWKELLNSDARDYGGHGFGNMGQAQAEAVPWHAQPFSLSLTLPPLAVLFFKHQPQPVENVTDNENIREKAGDTDADFPTDPLAGISNNSV